ncbi:MAG TPA: SH3 domain-containing protein [Anaerolineales bacterium]
MDTIKSLFTQFLNYSLVTLLVACNIFVNAPIQATEPLATFVQSTPTEHPSPTSSPTSTPPVAPTKTLTNTPTHIPTSTPTNSPTNTPINTPLPPLPDFEQVLTFALGGGGACEGDPKKQPNIRVLFVNPGYRAIICFRDIFGSLRIDWYAPDGRIFTSIIDAASSGEFFFRWPLSLPSGQWRLHAYGNGFSEYVDFSVPTENISRPYISAIDPRSVNEINYPDSMPLKRNGNLDVIGLNYPAKTPIYLLVYHTSPTSGEYRLVHKRSVLSDPNGSIATELSGLLKVGELYLVIGISDPHVSLVNSDNGLFNTELPFDHFEVLPSKSTSSCPGAPQQRMVVNQRGFVCTQADNVRLRNAPQESASVITSLPVSSQFTVLGGPSCSDNWSWWQVETDDGYTGWISEGGDEVDPYFICPLH